jgi:serine protease Do
MTDGIISAINRDVKLENRSMVLIQTTAALNAGNSGGALLNEWGQVVGITTLKMSSWYESIEGLGFAIPTAIAKLIVDDLIAVGNVTGRPTIGITVRA